MLLLINDWNAFVKHFRFTLVARKGNITLLQKDGFMWGQLFYWKNSTVEEHVLIHLDILRFKIDKKGTGHYIYV